jgi:hypothetical protein
VIHHARLGGGDSTVFISGARCDWLAAPAGELPGEDSYETFGDFVRAYSSDYDDVAIFPGRVRRIAGYDLAEVCIEDGAT